MWGNEAGHTPRVACQSQPSTHNSIWRRGTPDKALHLTTVPSHSKLHRLTGDDRGSCRQEDPVRPVRSRANSFVCLLDRSHPLRTLTVYIKWYLSLSHSNPRHDGPAGIGAGICLGH